MSQMPQQAALPTCPSCAEPLESGDRFCGACGYDLSAVPARPEDHPTIALHGAAPGRAAGVEWPAAPQADGSGRPDPVHRPADLPGTDSGGGPLAADPPRPVQPPQPPPPQVPPPPQAPPGTPVPPPPQGPPPSAQLPAQVPPQPLYPPAVAPQEPVPAPAQAPDPRVPAGVPAQGAAAEPAGGVPVCVACRAGRVDDDGYCEHCGHAQPRERDHLEQESGPVAAVSDRGLRHHRNEDAFTVGHTVLPDGSPAAVAIVCDGVSSATRPDDASLAASRAAGESLLAALPRGTHPQQAMHDAIVAASHAVNALADEPATAREQAPHQNAPACTLVGAVVTSGLLVVGWVGDSRAYWVPTDRGAPAARLTEDDSWAAQMVAAGLMSEAEAYADERAHAITGWLGADAYELDPHTATFKPDRPGVVVVCTDGLWNYAESAAEMAHVVPADAAVNPLHSARVLVGHALDGGGHDNVTVALVPFPAAPRGAGSV
ncbi:PP2C family serine/threonine-protein phosphatase [Streptomyces leeuwenhoekii]|uniref:Protein phosphatase prpC n=3 Tax=Streptomyces leeuwenhoekii TaxID=1437453 RepID=A0A0F7VU30_STRLW|nr:PP2C family serine/threonine-protein phosphatase [Streptomyces leeuwenhoekii]KMS78706.1 serine/threonine protein phosphatase [Streptomyces leeuwenhoekii]CQR64014.1 Protein phosphatase prpC [Streptomyces leeuwenhoekii]